MAEDMVQVTLIGTQETIVAALKKALWEVEGGVEGPAIYASGNGDVDPEVTILFDVNDDEVDEEYRDRLVAEVS